MTGDRPVVLLGSDGPATRMIYHALAAAFPRVEVVIERRLSKPYIFWRRLRSLGPVRAVSQVPFRLFVIPWLVRQGRSRIAEIKRVYHLNNGDIPRVAARVSSVNTPAARAALRALTPAVVAVSGTRIIGRETLECVAAPFINMHGGITPLYRGVHGGYWALVDGRPDLVGSTVHRVDTGIDTGAVVSQVTFDVTPDDSFATYPYLHTAVGLPPFIEAIRQALDGSLGPGRSIALPSQLRTHPTIFEYLRLRLVKGVR